MKTVRVRDKDFRLFLTPQQIEGRVQELADTLNQEYAGKRPILLPILNGAFLFAADLIRRLKVQPELQFIRVSSYGQSMQSSGKVELLVGLDIDIEGRHILIVEDIVDTGLTYDYVKDYLLKKNAASVEIVSLLFKEANFKGQNRPSFVGYTIPPAFVVGYGLDYAQSGRELDGIYTVVEEK